jgi:hypothetical protein
MNVQAKTLQYTVRGIDSHTDLALRRLARKQAVSLNDVLVMSLKQFTGSNGSAWQEFYGSTLPDPAVNKALAAQRKVFAKDWQN